MASAGSAAMSAGELRVRYLSFWKAIAAQSEHCATSVRLYNCDSSLTAELVAVDGKQTQLLMRNCQTPSGTHSNLLLRTSDCIAAEFSPASEASSTRGRTIQVKNRTPERGDADTEQISVPEKRVDAADGEAYTREEFIEYYGGTSEWKKARKYQPAEPAPQPAIAAKRSRARQRRASMGSITVEASAESVGTDDVNTAGVPGSAKAGTSTGSVDSMDTSTQAPKPKPAYRHPKSSRARQRSASIDDELKHLKAAAAAVASQTPSSSGDEHAVQAKAMRKPRQAAKSGRRDRDGSIGDELQMIESMTAAQAAELAELGMEIGERSSSTAGLGIRSKFWLSPVAEVSGDSGTLVGKTDSRGVQRSKDLQADDHTQASLSSERMSNDNGEVQGPLPLLEEQPENLGVAGTTLAFVGKLKKMSLAQKAASKGLRLELMNSHIEDEQKLPASGNSPPPPSPPTEAKVQARSTPRRPSGGPPPLPSPEQRAMQAHSGRDTGVAKAMLKTSSLWANGCGKVILVGDDLENVQTLGVGTFSTVKLVRHRSSDKPYALKIMAKARLDKFNQKAHVMNEKNILMELGTSTAQSPFILSLLATGQDRDSLYMLTEAVPGGELFGRLQQVGVLAESDVRFYAACVVSALACCHRLGAVFRDLKPENLLIDHEGYLKLCDFGFAKKIGLEAGARTRTRCGTAEYVSPELVDGWCDFATDWWSLGVLIYECLQGVAPFAASEAEDPSYGATYKRIKTFAKQVGQCKFADREIPLRARWAADEAREGLATRSAPGWAPRSSACLSLVAALLQPETKDRLGCGGRATGEPTDLMDHPWFLVPLPVTANENQASNSKTVAASFWAKLEARQLDPPWRPDSHFTSGSDGDVGEQGDWANAKTDAYMVDSSWSAGF